MAPIGKACFICEYDGNTPDAGDRDNTGICSSCLPTVIVLDLGKGQLVLCHNVGHMVGDPKVDRTTEPCGLCLRPWPMCLFFLKRGKGSKRSLKLDLERSTGCTNMIKFAYGVAAKSTSSSPCSNVPMICPLCSKDDPAVWRYNMMYHFKRQHPRAVLSDYEYLWEVSKFEKLEMQRIWRERHKVPVKRTNKKALPPLVLSQAHSSRLAFRQVIAFFIDCLN